MASRQQPPGAALRSTAKVEDDSTEQQGTQRQLEHSRLEKSQKEASHEELPDGRRSPAGYALLVDQVKDLKSRMLDGLGLDQLQSFLKIWGDCSAKRETISICGRLSDAGLGWTILAVPLWHVHDTLTKDDPCMMELLTNFANTLRDLEAQPKNILAHSGSKFVVYNILYGAYTSRMLSNQAVSLWELCLMFHNSPMFEGLARYFDDWVRTSAVVRERSGFTGATMTALCDFLSRTEQERCGMPHILIHVMAEISAWDALEEIRARGVDPDVTSLGVSLSTQQQDARQGTGGDSLAESRPTQDYEQYIRLNYASRPFYPWEIAGFKLALCITSQMANTEPYDRSTHDCWQHRQAIPKVHNPRGGLLNACPDSLRFRLSVPLLTGMQQEASASMERSATRTIGGGYVLRQSKSWKQPPGHKRQWSALKVECVPPSGAGGSKEDIFRKTKDFERSDSLPSALSLPSPMSFDQPEPTHTRPESGESAWAVYKTVQVDVESTYLRKPTSDTTLLDLGRGVHRREEWSLPTQRP